MNLLNKNKWLFNYCCLLFSLFMIFFLPSPVFSDNAEGSGMFLSDLSFHPCIPGYYYSMSEESIEFMPLSCKLFFIEDKKGNPDLLAIKTTIKPPEKYIGSVRLWNWICLGLLTTNIATIALVPIAENEDYGQAVGIACMASHELWSLSNLFLGFSYYNLRQSMYTYEKKALPDFGMYTAFASFLTAAFALTIGAMLFDNFNENIMLVTLSLVGISNLCGIGTIVYTFIYDNTVYQK
jgi:hypothetical protein